MRERAAASLAWVALVALLVSCGSSGPRQPPPPGAPPPSASALPGGGEPPRILADGLATSAIDGVARFDAMAQVDGGLLLPGKTLKFLIDRRQPKTPVVYFMNSNFKGPDGKQPESAKFHFHLAEVVLPNFHETLDTFRPVTYDTQDKRYVAGSIQTYFIGGSSAPLYGIQFFPEDVIAEGALVDAIRTLMPHLRLGGAKLAFVATGQAQTVSAAAARELEALGAPARKLDDVLGAVDYIPLNRGEAWGYLRMNPREPDALAAVDIPVFRELPLDLTVVAATITSAYQDPTSHVNLKSKERGTPNMVLRSAGPTDGVLSKFADKPVHLTVGLGDFEVEPSTDEEVRSRLAARNAKPWVRLVYEPTDELRSFAGMCPMRATECLAWPKRVGGKAAMLGFLQSAQVLGKESDVNTLSHRYGYDLVPAGLGVPFKYYRDFVAHPPNGVLREALQALIATAKSGAASPRDLAAKSEAVRERFYEASFPPGMVERVAARIAEVLPGSAKVKVRSSANAEDLPGFDGAGLYESFAANLKKDDKKGEKDADGAACHVVQDGVKLKMKPKTLACAIKGVFASVWNKRAIDERTYARLDHQDAAMGLAIVADYDLEEQIAANAVVVTRIIASRNVFGYTLATQKGNVLVTNPTPGTLAENMIAAFNTPRERPKFTVTRFAIPEAGKPPLTVPVLSDTALRQIVEITRTAEEAYCFAKAGYYPNDCLYAPADPTKPHALDFELKILESGRFVCKQMREFTGG